MLVGTHAYLYTSTYPCQRIEGLKGVGIHPHPNPLPEGEGACWLVLMFVFTLLPTLVALRERGLGRKTEWYINTKLKRH